MLIIKIKFETGMYHATPMGRNVLEAATEWPISPYRFIRAILDSWYRKRSYLGIDHVEPILELLTNSLPKFHLPKAKENFLKLYVPQNDPYQKEVIYDAFLSIAPEDCIYMCWDDITLTTEQTRDLSELLSVINYLGRSESWVSISIYDGNLELSWNAIPSNSKAKDLNSENIDIAVPLSKSEYLKNNWIEALSLSSDELLENQINIPYAMKYVRYSVPTDRFYILPKPRPVRKERKINAVLFALESKVRPRITDTVIISDRIHQKLMGIYKKITGNADKISYKFSGRNNDGTIIKGHKHIFIYPLDNNKDGYLDHLFIKCKEFFDDQELLTLDNLKSIWQGNGKPDISIIPIQWGTAEEIDPYKNKKSNVFKSETPVILTRHYRKGRGDYKEWIINEIKHEALNVGIPAPKSVKFIKKLDRKGHDSYWLEFVRSRKNDVEKIGYGFVLEFSEPLTENIFSIGYGAHFGLGLFVPEIGKKNEI
jgi:CRISPR-associated protein Csb2